MNISTFKVEQWMNEYETGAKYNIAETCVNSISLNELFELTGTDKQQFLDKLCERRLTYGDITGLPSFKNGICSLYSTVKADDIVVTHGAAGANHHIFYSLVNPGDKIISIMPTYQQLYSIPESFGADVHLINLTVENKYLPDMNQLKKLAPGAKMICINNPNNPTGALISNEQLSDVAEIAREVGAYVLCDETYRHLTQEDIWCNSIADIYEKGISVSSMSKVFSLAGLRLGWIACRDTNVVETCLNHRDYDLISCGIFDEATASLALENADILLQRSKNIVRQNLTVLDTWINSEPAVYYHKPLAGTTALVYYKADIDSYQLCKDLYYKTGAFVTPGDCFEQPRSMRIGYACDVKTLESGLMAISTYFREYI